MNIPPLTVNERAYATLSLGVSSENNITPYSSTIQVRVGLAFALVVSGSLVFHISQEPMRDSRAYASDSQIINSNTSAKMSNGMLCPLTSPIGGLKASYYISYISQEERRETIFLNAPLG